MRLLGCLLLCVVWQIAPAVHAQGAAKVPGAMPNVSFVGKTVFSLPVLLDQSLAGQLREIELYMRRKADLPWQIAQTIRPTERAFVIKAVEDGEYQFAVVGVDKQGRRSVGNLAMKSPDSVIAVDTQPPHIDIAVAGDTPEGLQLNCSTVDANPNPLATEFYYQTRDQQWQRLAPLPNQPEKFCIPQVAAITGMVRVVTKDRAGNPASREMNVTGFRQQTAIAAPTPPPLPTAAPSVAEPPAPAPFAGKTLFAQTVEPKQELPRGNGPQFPPPHSEAPALPQPPRVPAEPPLPPKADPLTMTAPPSDLAARATSIEPPPLPPVNHDSLRPATPYMDPHSMQDIQPASAVESRQFINRPRVYLAYEVERGAGNNAKIQVWLSRDHGQSWQHGGEDADGRSPAEIRLPAEGVIGVRLAAGATSAAANDATSWIELDVTKPIIDLKVRREAARLLISYAARDKNLATDPVDLYYAADPQGPWLPIAAGLPGTGEHQWDIPETLRGRPLAIRAVASDLAGNAAQAEDAGISTTEGAASPRVRFLGVSSFPQ